jgi:ADP-ribosyl-[dinitrogen reductase] hydrolase
MIHHPLQRHQSLTTPQQHAAIGALVGSAVGDALGAPFEFQPGGRYRATFPQPVVGGRGEMLGGGGFGWRPGEFTDDTQMALALAQSLVQHQGVHPADLFARWKVWATQAPDVGVITRSSLRHASVEGAATAAHHALGRSAGNGALMRVTPIALAYATAPEATATHECMQAALLQSAVTHHDPAAGWGAAIAAEVIRRTILGADPMAEIADVVALVPAEHRERYVTMLAPHWQPGGRDEPGNGSVWTCLAQAVWAVRHHATFHDAVTAAIDLGDDTDTVACVAGALAGARCGIQAIPSRFTTYVHGRLHTAQGEVVFHNADLQALGRSLLGLGTSAEPPAESPAGPHEVLPGVFAADLSAATEAARHHEYAVLSLCRVGDAFRDVAHRREVYLVDQAGPLDNPALDLAVADAVATITAWRAEGRDVLVHCHGGRSRTALVLQAYAMATQGMSADEAHQWLTATWSRYDPWNPAFREFLQHRWPG